MILNPGNNSQLAQTIAGIFQKKIEQSLEIALTRPPEVVEKSIIEYSGRMRASGLEKFNDPCFVTVTNFFYSQHDFEGKNACGTLVLYFREECVERLLKRMGQRDFDEEDIDFVLQALGKFTETLVRDVKSALESKGYSELIHSDPSGYKNEVLNGVLYPHDETKFQEIDFNFWNLKALVVDFVMASVTK